MYFDPHQFSERENDVVKLLLEGKSNKQIALQLGISSRTVEFHLSNIYRKLNVKSRSEAILRLAETGLRESTGDVPEKSTVVETGDSAENGPQPILRRLPVKPLYLFLGGLATVILVAVIVIKLSAQNPGANPATTSVLVTAMSTSTLPSATAAPTSTEAIPTPTVSAPATHIPFPPHTVNGYTAAIEGYYADLSHLSFQVRVTDPQGHTGFSEEYLPMPPNLYDEYGRLINASAGLGPALDPTLIEFGLVPVTLFKGDRIKGQFVFDIVSRNDFNQVFAQFHFDFEIPLYPDVRFYPKQSVTANGLDMLLDSVTVSPTFTQTYVCFNPPSPDPWIIGRQAILEIGEWQAPLYHVAEVFSTESGTYWRTENEPYWVPPVKTGKCSKIVFPLGSLNATSLTLIIPDLEKFEPMSVPPEQLARDYPGLSPKEAYHTYLEEHDSVYKGPWIFKVELTQ